MGKKSVGEPEKNIGASGRMRLRRGPLPGKYQGPTLNAKGNEIGIESVDIAHEGIEPSDGEDK